MKFKSPEHRELYFNLCLTQMSYENVGCNLRSWAFMLFRYVFVKEDITVARFEYIITLTTLNSLNLRSNLYLLVRLGYLLRPGRGREGYMINPHCLRFPILLKIWNLANGEEDGTPENVPS